MVGDHQDGMGYGDNGFLPPSTGCDPLVERSPIGLLGVGCPVGRFGAGLPQPGTALARFPAPPLARTLMIAWTDPCPGGEVLRAGKAPHIHLQTIPLLDAQPLAMRLSRLSIPTTI